MSEEDEAVPEAVEEEPDDEVYMELDDEETPVDNVRFTPPDEEETLPPRLIPITRVGSAPPPILQPVPVPLPQSPVLTLPSGGWTSSDWAGKRFTLKAYDQGATLKKQLKEYRSYWLNSHVPNRKGKKLSSVTVEKRVERLCGYLGFLKLAKAVQDVRTLAFEGVLDSTGVVSFLDWLEHVRSSSEGNRSEYLSAIINCVKFLYRDVAEDIKGVRCSRVTVVERYKDMRNSLQSIASRKRKSKHSLEETNQWVDWEEDFLPMVEKQQVLFDECAGERSKKSARLLHDLVLLRWETVGPSRAGEIRTVEYLSWDELSALRGRRSMSAWAKSKRRNVLTKRPIGGREGEVGCWTLYLAVYKTARWTGVDTTELDAEFFPELCSALDVFLLGSREDGPLRSLLKPLDQHCFVFMSSTGGGLSANYFSSYLANVIERHTGSRPTASMLRSSFVTSMLDSEAGADMRSREAIALQMRHSVREQSRTYDRRSRQQKKRRAMEFVSTAPSSSPVTSPPSPGFVQISLVPFARDDVVVVRGAEGVTLAKVLLSGPEGVVLMGLQHVEGTFYTVDDQMVWMQTDPRVLQFVDTVWNEQRRAYDLRSLLH